MAISLLTGLYLTCVSVASGVSGRAQGSAQVWEYGYDIDHLLPELLIWAIASKNTGSFAIA